MEDKKFPFVSVSEAIAYLAANEPDRLGQAFIDLLQEWEAFAIRRPDGVIAFRSTAAALEKASEDEITEKHMRPCTALDLTAPGSPRTSFASGVIIKISIPAGQAFTDGGVCACDPQVDRLPEPGGRRSWPASRTPPAARGWPRRRRPPGSCREQPPPPPSA